MDFWDTANGTFEFIGSIATWLNVRMMIRDKEAKGIDWRVFVFYTLWGTFNLFYYPHLGQMFSFYGGISIVFANSVWVGLYLYYRK